MLSSKGWFKKNKKEDLRSKDYLKNADPEGRVFKSKTSQKKRNDSYSLSKERIASDRSSADEDHGSDNIVAVCDEIFAKVLVVCRSSGIYDEIPRELIYKNVFYDKNLVKEVIDSHKEEFIDNDVVIEGWL